MWLETVNHGPSYGDAQHVAADPLSTQDPGVWAVQPASDLPVCMSVTQQNCVAGVGRR